MVLKFYGHLASPPVRAVDFTIKNLGIPVEMVELDVSNREHKSEEYLKVNSLGTIPCIDDDGFVLLDSHAINIYLTTKYPQGEKLYPSDPKKRAIVNERLFFETGELFGLAKVTLKKVYTEGITEIDEDTVKLFENSYNSLETYLKNSKYIAGNSITIADFSVLATMTTMKLLVPADEEKFPLLSAYLKDAVTWPFYAEVNEAGHNKLLKLWKSQNIQFAK